MLTGIGNIHSSDNFDYDRYLDDQLARSQGEDEIEMRRRRVQERDIIDADPERY